MDISSDSNDKKSRNQAFDWSNIWPLPDKSNHFYTDWEPMWFLCQSDQKISAPASHRFLLSKTWSTIVCTRNTPEIMHFTSYNVLTFVLLGALAEKLGLPLPWCCRRRPHDDKVCNRRSTVCLQNVNFLISAREMFSFQAQMFSLLSRILNSGWNQVEPISQCLPNPSVYIESDFDALMWLCRAWIYWIEPALYGGQTFAMSFTTMRCFMITLLTFLLLLINL